ncbi:hypothetical protein LAZ40_12630 [Cereibacter sphaeroides]|uniref:hypothetical protein n=1 Tax=Cereibacter sphaeroides TaxID=1063 RepID=UPI001F446D20|nr:hypothetical protein [Cereibacter sphaeroides]MCE6959869.1 hypothetical protein [Cereibacter sphaeroides]MCE6974723.1 hypothetical protein [Cereibacter sphaeroides]
MPVTVRCSLPCPTFLIDGDGHASRQCLCLVYPAGHPAQEPRPRPSRLEVGAAEAQRQEIMPRTSVSAG